MAGANPTVPAPQTPGPSGDTGIGNAPTGGMTTAEVDAWDLLRDVLSAYGFTPSQLQQLTAWTKEMVIQGNNSDLITLSLTQQPAFKERFPAIGTLSKEGIAITPAEYISMEQSYAQIEHAAGLPANFASYDALIAGQVSPTEYQARVTQGYQAVAMADPTVIKAMQDFYGVKPGQLAAYFLNPKAAEPLLLQQATSAQIGGAAAMAGFSAPGGAKTPEGISQSQALNLAKLGVTQSTAQTGFQKLAEEKQLYEPLPGAGHVGNQLTTDRLLQGQFGSDGQTQLQLQLQAAFETGTTQQGSSVAQTQAGATGVGAVQR